MSLSRRITLALPYIATAMTCTSCSYMGGDLLAVSQVAKNLWNGPQAVTLEQVSAIPYATIGVKIGNSNQVILILATDTNQQRLWTSGNRISVVTNADGRIIRTAGLGQDLSSYVVANNTSAQSFQWQADFKDLGLYGVTGACEIRPAKSEEITLLGKPFHTLRVEERCESKQLHWRYENIFWRDPGDGFVWRSRQRIHPKMSPIETETLRPPA